ncbi:hypothetical protein GRX01_07835 [Halobaculum sp. WSA2]|uniref:EVE domain-containing protein n=1 Tax=Halobaculum saliterrae TaxID=2073113 RepID=A0A6B0SUC8_9EURY|nr:hypothetical protein [Halobaculum saliterrae]MXR41246.1 hypothetical protein [Halobaculum saliterrae]
MADIFLVPVGDGWIEEFRDTVESPVQLDGEQTIEELSDHEEARIWGTTRGGFKQDYYESMEPDDVLLFYSAGEYFATGRVGERFESSGVGEWLWDNPESRFNYTITDFEPVSLSREDLNSLLGYEENHSPQGFLRVSDTARTNLLQRYNSVEAAFQDIRDGGLELEGRDDGKEDDEDEPDDSPREHTEIQWHLVQLGLKHDYEVYVAKNDQNLTYDGRRLADGCMEDLELTGFSDAAMRIIEYVDVIWLDGDYIAKMFEVESTTSVYSGILRMSDFVVKVPNLAVEMHIVASEEDEQKVRREMERPTFQRVMGMPDHSTLRYTSFEEVRKKHQTVQDAGPLQSVF